MIYENDSYMLFPFLKREFTYNEKTFFDFETAYGYGGPICNVNNESFWVAALRSLSQEFSNHGCVAGFVRFQMCIRDRTWTGFLRIQVMMAYNQCLGITLMQLFNQFSQRSLLCFRSGVFRRCSAIIQSAYVAYTYTVARCV